MTQLLIFPLLFYDSFFFPIFALNHLTIPHNNVCTKALLQPIK